MKKCSFCEREVPKLFYANPKCCNAGSCKTQYQKAKGKKISGSTITQKVRKPTGELQLFLKIYAEKKGLCEVTGEQIPFNVSNFAHILSKGAYGKFRLNPENIIHIKPEVHDLYDNSDKKTLLSKFPSAAIIYDRKDKLRHDYYHKDYEFE